MLMKRNLRAVFDFVSVSAEIPFCPFCFSFFMLAFQFALHYVWLVSLSVVLSVDGNFIITNG